MLATLPSICAVLGLFSGPPDPETVLPVRFNTTQGSHMVLQQAPAKSAVYGTVGPGGVAVSVTVAGANDEGLEVTPYTVHAAVAGGQWKAMLRPTPAGGSYTITARCTGCRNATSATIDDVTFGDLWYCAGQSNVRAMPILRFCTHLLLGLSDFSVPL